MKNRSVFLSTLLALGLIACDSETVQVISTDGSVPNTEATDTGATDNSSTTDSDSSDNTTTNGTDSTSSTDATDSTNNTDTNDSTTTIATDGMLSNPGRLHNLVGLVKVEAVNTDSDFSRGIFTRLDTALTAQNILEFFVPASDFCEVTRYNAAFPQGNAFKIYDQEPTLISAGESITLNTTTGNYATLERQIVEGTGLIYRSNTPLSENIPAGLVLDVPGEVYPGFASVPVSGVPALQVTAPAANTPVTDESEFLWNANSDPLSVFEIYAGYTSPETNEVIEIGCTVIDDGQFTFDAATRAALGDDFTADWSSVLRVVYDVAESEDGILFVANSIN